MLKNVSTLGGIILLLSITGCSDDGQFGLEGSPAWKWRASEAEQQAYYERFSPFEEVMLNGEVLASNMNQWGTTVTQVKYNGKVYTCWSYLKPMGTEPAGECKY